jgi:hypothetical protein
MTETVLSLDKTMAVTRKKRTTKAANSRTARRSPRQTAKRVEQPKNPRSLKGEDLKAAVAKVEKHLNTLGEEPEFLQRIHRAAKENGTEYLSLRAINREIKKAREELRLKNE